MARVVIIWNEHPLEAVAGVHARKVAKMLKNEYGHNVRILKIKPKNTNYEIAKNGDANDALYNLSNLPTSFEIAENHLDRNNFVFNFHSSEARAFGEAKMRTPNDFRVTYAQLNSKESTTKQAIKKIKRREIVIFKKKTRAFCVECPGENIQLPRRLANQWINRKTDLMDAAVVGGRQRIRALFRMKSDYFDNVKLAKGKYASEEISKKIAKAIHEQITRQK